MGFDLIIRGGTVVDGTGMPRFTADVAVKDGRIASIGKVTARADRVMEADGLILAPGFIDVHTHYDAQVDWDVTASPSCWHGVTTVLAGNCGFTLAPAKPEDCEWLAKMLSRVEGMSPDALGEGMRWNGGTFGEFWDRVEGRVAVNIGGFVGHSAVRRFVMGEAASEREARPDEVAAMQELVRAAMREGASSRRRSSTSTSPTMGAKCHPTMRLRTRSSLCARCWPNSVAVSWNLSRIALLPGTTKRIARSCSE